MYILYLDDYRKPADSYYYTHDEDYLRTDWVIVRSHSEFKKHIKKNGLPSLVSFDHDLCADHYVTYRFDYDNCTVPTGYHSAEWMANHCRKMNLPLPDYKCHSLNLKGKLNILKLLQSCENQLN